MATNLNTAAGAGSSAAPELCWLEEVRKDDVALVGGKCSSLGELINAGVRVPPGFALTTHGFARCSSQSAYASSPAVGEIPWNARATAARRGGIAPT